jgi:chemosensory pili system protein ChpA (sensor histidine kinase/response regulator)
LKNMNYSALTWVKTSIDENIEQTRQALGQFVEESSDTSVLEECVNLLHEIYGVLNVLDLQTAVLLIQEIESVMKSIQAGEIENSESTYEVLLAALIQLPNYLDNLVITQRDIPLALLPILNELRTLGQKNNFTAKDFFTPKLFISIPEQKSIKAPDDKLKEHMQKMRVAYQKGLAAIVKTPKEPTAGLKFLYTVMQHLQQATGTAPISQFWWVTEGILEALLQKGLQINKYIFNLLKQLDALINQVALHGNSALHKEIPKDLLVNLLYIVGHSSSEGKQIKAIKTAFQLNDFLASENEIAAAKLTFEGPDIELMKTLVVLLNEDLARVEQTIDIFNPEQDDFITELNPLIIILRKISNILELLGLKVESNSLQIQASLILDICEDRQKITDSTFLEIVEALLKTRSAIEILGMQGLHAIERIEKGADADFSTTASFDIIRHKGIKNAITEIRKVIEYLSNFIETNIVDEHLSTVPKHLKQVEGLLSILSYEHAAQLLARFSQYMKDVFIKEGNIPTDKNKLYALGEVLIGIELYLETIVGHPINADNLLSIINDQLSVIEA